ncbi:hypothetical protein GCM10008941_08240 [Rhizomicrobium palustre]
MRGDAVADFENIRQGLIDIAHALPQRLTSLCIAKYTAAWGKRKGEFGPLPNVGEDAKSCV